MVAVADAYIEALDAFLEMEITSDQLLDRLDELCNMAEAEADADPENFDASILSISMMNTKTSVVLYANYGKGSLEEIKEERNELYQYVYG